MTRAGNRTSLPLLLAVVGLVTFAVLPGSLAPAATLLFCPGWGLLRLVSVVDRAFFVCGASLCGSTLVLAGLTLAAQHQGWSPEHLALATHGTAVLLCFAGRLRLAAYDRWLGRQPPHPEPMPLWPRRTPLCLTIVALSLLVVAVVIDPFHPATGSQHFEMALNARLWLDHASPVATTLGSGGFHGAVAAGLAAGSGSHVLVTSALLSLSALAAALLLVAEAICRLWGNRGGAGAMAALLLGLNPLVGLTLLATEAGYPAGEQLAGSLDPSLATALLPFVNGSPLALTLAFTALLLTATLSTLRRASYHVPRVMALAALGLVLSHATAAWLLLPGWLVGLAWSHRACVRHPDASLRRGGSGQREREPVYIRAPFWRPALHLTLGAGLGFAITGWPDLQWQPSLSAAWSVAAVVFPASLFFVPGVRHLNASPGREAYFFLGLLGTALAGGLLISAGGPATVPLCVLLSLVMAVPTSTGALKLVERFGLGAQLALTALAIGLVIAPALWLSAAQQRPRAVTVIDGLRVNAPEVPLDFRRALALVASSAPDTAVLLIDRDMEADELMAVRLLAGRTLLRDLGDDDALVLAALLAQPAKPSLALSRLRGHPSLAGRELWAISQGPVWPGFAAVATPPSLASADAPSLLVSRARPPDVVLLTISSLRADRLQPDDMPLLSARAERGLRFDTVVTPLPSSLPGLSTLLTGLAPVDHDVRSAGGQLHPQLPRMATSFAARGYRTAAVVALAGDHGLTEGFESVLARPQAHHDSLVAAARAELAAADRRPLFLWVHLSDLELPYDIPADARSPATGAFMFPQAADLAQTHYGNAAFPPSPLPNREAGLVDVATGVAQYDTSVALLDQSIGRLIDSIPDDDLLVVTAPHGTSLSEHEAWFLSGPDLFEPSIRVPLVLVGAGLPAGRQSRLTGLQDVAELILQGQLPTRQRIMLESDWRPGLGTGRAYDPLIDPTCRGAALRIWGERTETTKTLMTRPPSAQEDEAGLTFDLTRDLEETLALPADPFVLRRIDSWRRQGQPPRIDS